MLKLPGFIDISDVKLDSPDVLRALAALLSFGARFVHIPLDEHGRGFQSSERGSNNGDAPPSRTLDPWSLDVMELTSQETLVLGTLLPRLRIRSKAAQDEPVSLPLRGSVENSAHARTKGFEPATEPVGVLNLPWGIEEGLGYGGIVTMQQLLQSLPRDVLRCPGLGPGALRTVRLTLAQRGLALRGETSDPESWCEEIKGVGRNKSPATYV